MAYFLYGFNISCEEEVLIIQFARNTTLFSRKHYLQKKI